MLTINDRRIPIALLTFTAAVSSCAAFSIGDNGRQFSYHVGESKEELSFHSMTNLKYNFSKKLRYDTKLSVKSKLAEKINSSSTKKNGFTGVDSSSLKSRISKSMQNNDKFISDFRSGVEIEKEVFDSNDENFPSKEVLVFIGLCWCVGLLSALDRVAMSVALLPMTQQLGFTESMKGSIASLFSVGYGLFIVPCGLILSQVSPRAVLAVGVFCWSLSTAFTPIAAMSGFGTLLAVRCTMGAAESVVLPSINKMLIKWIPPERKSLAVATIFSGLQSGTVAAYLISPTILENFGWQNLFYIYGAIGALWVIPWLLYARDSPNDPTSSDEFQLKQSSTELSIDRSDEKSIADIWSGAMKEGSRILEEAPLREMRQSIPVIAIAVAHAANNWGLYNNLAWSPTFYSETYGLNVRESAFFSVLPPVVGALSGIMAALVADKIIATGAELTVVRRAFQGIGLLGPAACMFCLANHIPETPENAQLLLTGAVAMAAFNSAGYGSATQEKAGEKWSGLLYSLTSLPGVLFGSVGVWITGQILEASGRWDQVYFLNGSINVLAGIFFIAFYNSKKEYD
mmetsp:Transcript_3624/g.4929  ORF Transcript_3624/g.4929 Transcript_3624/m.4929 type:complete len:571 (+) Transcript_3624:107-1819(+)|eukprot:CAMPEP_0116060840 /NCGR_PEP_ID=MMETSP0322-20121206/6669_1 /TAXON_ID=163516 /ORGANISM="Leptocylindrus danicus var. apora, Strain B651" /LENGTH=570 /DNA_ID=CAMNT_0003545565 /DNA_START=52 /DNA_END=1764 /DNA_ORIENTATION=-